LLIRSLVGISASGAIAWYARWRGSLSRSGTAAAVAIGAAIYCGGGWPWFATLAVFFFTSTLLGRVGRAAKATTKLEFEKGDTRDGWQALANGGLAAGAAIGMAIAPSPALAGAFLGALATANADTWATELGVLSRAEPRRLLGLRRVPRGTSGAVSPLGLFATIGGAAVIGACAAIAPRPYLLPRGTIVLITMVAGTLGSLADSLLGATLQEMRFCPRCARETEQTTHHCGAATEHRRGITGLGNDLVNAKATALGALAGAALAWLHQG
jgi:uncharacterized protein (TIGR00297 family)